ncbi:MAG TPA: FAD:protein FMN transferase [Rubrivivax sp.]
MNPLPSPARRAALAAGFGSFALLAAGCGERGRFFALPGGRTQAFHGLAMGSSYTVKIAGPALSDAALAAARSAVAQALGDVVARMSHYDSDSEVSRLNRQPLGAPLAVSASTLQVFQVAQAVRSASEGAFDVAIGRAVDEWGFGPSGRPRAVLPAPALQQLREQHRDGALALDIQAGTVSRHREVWANLSGIAKGYGVDRAAEALEHLGLADYMVELGGEIRARGRNGEGRAWQLAIERPDAMPQRALRILPLDGRALATSGDYRNYFMHQGQRYSHEINPASAAPVAHALASVSVVADDCTQADAWSTALFVLGPERGFELATRRGLRAHFVVRQSDGSFSERQTAGFAALGGYAAG